MATAAPAPMRTNVAVTVLFFAALAVISASEAHWWNRETQKTVKITNIDEVKLAVRCFSFENGTLNATVLQPNESFTFSFEQNRFFPLSTMWNCSTYKGTFIAFIDYYDCNKNGHNLCEWSFDRKKTYRLSPNHEDKWIPYDFNPNYQSEVRGGVEPQPQDYTLEKKNTTEYD